MSNILAEFEYVNITKGYRLGSDGVQETRFKTKGELYKYCLKEYGRCVSKCYVGNGQQIGWVFEKRVKYSDCNETYLQETWVAIHDSMPVKHIEYHYAQF